MISKSRFENNFKDGVSIYNLIHHAQISDTVVTQNGYSGLHAIGAQGKLNVISSTFLKNQKHGVYVQNMTGSAGLVKVNSSENQESGIVFDGGTVSLLLSDNIIERNVVHGLHILNQLNATINISKAQFISSSRSAGIYMLNFAEDCDIQLSNISSIGNSRDNGASFQRLSLTRLTVTSSLFDENAWHGLSFVDVVADELILKKISTSKNHHTGIYVSGGNTNLYIESWSSVGNFKDGFYLDKQDGIVDVKNCKVDGNRRDGLSLVDGNYVRLEAIDIQNCTVSNNRYGILFALSYSKGLVNYAVTVADTIIANNTLGGCEFYTVGCASYSNHRRLQLSFTGNKVKGNQNYGLYFFGPEIFEPNATVKNNVFEGNTGYTLRVVYSDRCHGSYPFPLIVNVLENIFFKNRGEYIIFVDYNTLPDRRFMIMKNNTLSNNKCVRQFPSKYIRTKTQAVLAVHGGNFTVEQNSFDNPLCPHEMTTLFKDHERVIQARENWWGSTDECNVKERIFDFEDRVELAQIQYYPFLVHHNSTHVKLHNDTRPLCFLRGTKLGGTLNRPVTLPNGVIYQVTGDVIVLPKGILTMEENITLEFPLQAVFLVYGQVVIKGTNDKRVKFTPKKRQEELRLVDGPGPWDGRLEIWFNNTWMPVCLSRYRYESIIVCRQLGYEEQSYSRHYSSYKGKAFLHNVRCDTDKNDKITSCNQQNWISLSSCSYYVAYINCKIPYWTGIHLATTPKKSVITNLDISYAGFAYRNDLSVPGIALRVDLSHHHISGVKVDKPAFIGMQIMYQDPFQNTVDLNNSTISNSESDGIRLQSPLVDIQNTDVMNTKGSGIRFDGSWGQLNTHVISIADAEVKKHLNLCTDKHMLLDNSSLLYYLVVTPDRSQTCKTIITVARGYKIGLQLIYHVSRFVFNVYGGTNATSGMVWKVHLLTWSRRPTWMPNTSSILLESTGYYGYHSSVHFMLYLIKGKLLLNFKRERTRSSWCRIIMNTLSPIKAKIHNFTLLSGSTH